MAHHFLRFVYNIIWRRSSSSRMRVMNHNWSATKQRLHPQSVVEISLCYWGLIILMQSTYLRLQYRNHSWIHWHV